MRPYIAEILEHEGRTHTLPMPAKLRELEACVKALGLKDDADEDDVRVVGYKTLIGIKPDDFTVRSAYAAAERLADLSEEQAKAVASVHKAFGLKRYDAVIGIIESLEQIAKEDCD
jgi:hypothetical protein